MYHWYIEPLDAETNNSISELPNVIEIGEKICEDKKTHYLWECDHKTINFLKKSNVNFVPFVQEGNGKIRKWKL